MSSVDEKKLLKDIDMLKKALPDMAKLTIIDPELIEIREAKKKISVELDRLNGVIGTQEEKISENKEKSQAVWDQHAAVRDEADKFSVQIDKANEEVKQAYITKDQMRESYFKQLYEFELQNDKVRWIKGYINVQKNANAIKEEKQKRIVAKRADLEGRENPHTKEI